jgi:hypothetical protein
LERAGSELLGVPVESHGHGAKGSGDGDHVDGSGV